MEGLITKHVRQANLQNIDPQVLSIDQYTKARARFNSFCRLLGQCRLMYSQSSAAE